MRPLTPYDGRIAVTGFYAGFFVGRQWLELMSSGGCGLRAAYATQASVSVSPVSVPPVSVPPVSVPPVSVPHPDAVVPAGRCAPLVTPEFCRLTARVVEALSAANLWAEAGLTTDPQRVAISFAASKGCPQLSAKEAYLAAAVTSTCDWPAIALCRRVRSTGPVLAPVAACATGSHTIALGAQLIQDGYADVALAGSLEHGLTDVVLAGYRSLGALSAQGVMRPFDRSRDGFVPAEGMGCLVLEAEAKARARGATIYGYVTGWSMRADATAMTTMDANGDSIARAIDAAMCRAGHSRIDYINAHGTATRLNDVVETRGIKRVFGTGVPVSATKPLTGHLLGAAGSVEAVLCLLAMRENYAPPTLNLQSPDLECDLDLVAGAGRTMRVDSALSLSYGFGGHCGVLIFEK